MVSCEGMISAMSFDGGKRCAQPWFRQQETEGVRGIVLAQGPTLGPVWSFI